MTDQLVVDYLKTGEDFLRRYVNRTVEWIFKDMPDKEYDNVLVFSWYEHQEDLLVTAVHRHIQWYLAMKANKGEDPAEYLQELDYRQFAREILRDEDGIVAKLEEVGTERGFNIDESGRPGYYYDDEDDEMYAKSSDFSWTGPHMEENGWVQDR